MMQRDPGPVSYTHLDVYKRQADTLRMLTGKAPTKQQAAALDTYLVTVADHGLNASTFASRVVASTRAGLVSAVVAGIGALKGPLHGLSLIHI